MSATSQFDKHAGTYDAELNQALAASGEDKNYFALERVNWLETVSATVARAAQLRDRLWLRNR